ncbi:MAG TPA: hypothetical protein VF148_07005 [Acidimicrobiia bacterium]
MSAMTTTGLRIEMLGTLRAERDGTQAELGGPKQRAVLAMIVSEATGSIGRDRIIEGVWGEDASDENRHAFYTYLSNLRRVLGDVIVRTGDTYSLAIEPNSIDHLLFIAGVDEARRVLATDPGTAALTLREALGLWRGLCQPREKPLSAFTHGRAWTGSPRQPTVGWSDGREGEVPGPATAGR